MEILTAGDGHWTNTVPPVTRLLDVTLEVVEVTPSETSHEYRADLRSRVLRFGHWSTAG